MPIKTLDPRMINPDVVLRMNNTQFTNTTATNTTTNTFSSINIRTQDALTTALTGTNLNITNLQLTNLTATNNIVTNFLILTADNTFTLSNADNSKTYHVNTTVTPLVTAIFPNTLSNGFNVSLVNTGIGVIELSANPPLNAIGHVNSRQYTGVMVYKQNDQFYGIGVLE